MKAKYKNFAYHEQFQNKKLFPIANIKKVNIII